MANFLDFSSPILPKNVVENIPVTVIATLLKNFLILNNRNLLGLRIRVSNYWTEPFFGLGRGLLRTPGST